MTEAEKYRELHRCCPKCGNSNLEVTTIGYPVYNIDLHVDYNRATCLCGWKGIIHDLVERKK